MGPAAISMRSNEHAAKGDCGNAWTPATDDGSRGGLVSRIIAITGWRAGVSEIRHLRCEVVGCAAIHRGHPTPCPKGYCGAGRRGPFRLNVFPHQGWCRPAAWRERLSMPWGDRLNGDLVRGNKAKEGSDQGSFCKDPAIRSVQRPRNRGCHASDVSDPVFGKVAAGLA